MASIDAAWTIRARSWPRGRQLRLGRRNPVMAACCILRAVKKRILVVEDDQALARLLADNLMYSGFEVQALEGGPEVLTAVRTFNPDLVLLDVMLPGPSGFELCGLIREGGRTPIIMLTARDQKADKLMGLEAGADDYITKPFDFDELKARLHALLRRARRNVVRVRLGEVLIDFQNLRADRRGQDLHLTRREFDVLFYLAERRGLVVHRSELLREIWGYPTEPVTRAVDYAIKRLRTKIEVDPHNPRYITTVHGDGYSLTFDDSEA
jgi:DNA-binding response OmpR family regulator